MHGLTQDLPMTHATLSQICGTHDIPRDVPMTHTAATRSALGPHGSVLQVRKVNVTTVHETRADNNNHKHGQLRLAPHVPKSMLGARPFRRQELRACAIPCPRHKQWKMGNAPRPLPQPQPPTQNTPQALQAQGTIPNCACTAARPASCARCRASGSDRLSLPHLLYMAR